MIKSILMIACVAWIGNVWAEAPYITDKKVWEADGATAAVAASVSGMRVQTERLKVASQNIANAQVTGDNKYSAPYRRKTIFFKNKFDHKHGTELVKVDRIDRDYSSLIVKYEPHHPAADDQGYVRYPNINLIVETIDAKEAQRSFEVNLNAFKISKSVQKLILQSTQ